MKRASAYPVAVDAEKVGTYPGLAKSRGGHFYDDLLEEEPLALALQREWIEEPRPVSTWVDRTIA